MDRQVLGVGILSISLAFFPTDALLTSKTEGIPLECPLVWALPFTDFMPTGFKQSVLCGVVNVFI